MEGALKDQWTLDGQLLLHKHCFMMTLAHKCGKKSPWWVTLLSHKGQDGAWHWASQQRELFTGPRWGAGGAEFSIGYCTLPAPEACEPETSTVHLTHALSFSNSEKAK